MEGWKRLPLKLTLSRGQFQVLKEGSERREMDDKCPSPTEGG
jgi:hypothetical protein